MPYEGRAEGDGQHCETLEVEGLAIAAYYANVSKVANGGLVKQSIVDYLVDDISHETKVREYPHWLSLDGHEHTNELHAWNFWSGLLDHRGQSGVDHLHGGTSLG